MCTKLIWTHRVWSRIMEPIMIYTGPVCTYYSTQFNVFMRLLTSWISGTLILVPSLRLFYSYQFALFNINVMVYVLSYILFCYVLLMSIVSLFISNEWQKISRSGWEGRSGRTGRGEEMESVIRIYYMRK